MIKYNPNKDSELLRLRVPECWLISMNKLYDVEPKRENENSTFIENAHEGFMLDVMWIQECFLDKEKRIYTVPQFHAWSIDVGWAPDSNYNGSYYATLQWIAKEEVINIEEIITRDRFELRDKLEYWMMDIYLNRREYRVMMEAKYS